MDWFPGWRRVFRAIPYRCAGFFREAMRGLAEAKNFGRLRVRCRGNHRDRTQFGRLYVESLFRRRLKGSPRNRDLLSRYRPQFGNATGRSDYFFGCRERSERKNIVWTENRVEMPARAIRIRPA